MVPQEVHTPATPSLPPTAVKEIEEMSLRLRFSQKMARKIVEVQTIDSLYTLTRLSDEYIGIICDVIHRPSRLVSRKTMDRRNQISILAAKNFKLVASC